MKKRMLTMIVMLAAAVSAQEVLTPEQAIALALEQNYDIRMAQTQAEIADNNVTLGNAGFLPRVTVNAGESRSVVDSKQSFLSGNVIDRRDAESKNRNAGATLNWTIFDGFDMFVTHARLRELRSLGDLQLKARIESTVEQVIKTYYDLVQQKNRLASLRDVLALSEERYRIVESQFGFGTASKLDVLNAQVDLNSDRSAVLRQEVTLTTVKTTLNQLLARNSGMVFDVADSIPLRDDLVLPAIRESAQASNTELLAASRNRRLAELDLRSLRTERLPTLSAAAGYSITRSQSQSGFINKNETEGLSYGLNLSYPLSDGFNLNRRLQNARLERRNSRLHYDKVLAQLDADLTRAHQRHQNYLLQSQLERRNVAAAREHMEIAFARYKVGTLTAIEWREAQLKHLDAVDRLLAAQYQAKLAETDLLKLAGQLVRAKE